ncbi:leucine Rich repeat-containing domain protein [Ancylostoma duodenale]|uniref:Leucine Rich repeat-containing domain protein n=1 Tax=Ancylostoma duodenale TaxID=51022 RepID=A0A0C2FVN4_9BILA|nr:leucine Rich repeat-containing domain protein [Ancylostoma duodenale]
MSSIDRKYRKDYANVRKLIISTNRFQNVSGLDMFRNCVLVIPSTLDNRRLSRIDLSSNSLTSLPDLSKLTSLTHLDVSSNQISSFKLMEKISKESSSLNSLVGVCKITLETVVFPGSLLTLNVSSNNIDDLTEFMRLLPLEKLESISLGEWLYSQGKGRAFKPDTGAHLSLVKYLEKYCPFDVEGKLVSSLDQSVVKAMEKRREMLSSSAYEDDSSHSLSLHSPYRAWTAQLEGKENQIPSSSADESGASRSISARIPTSSTPARQPSMTARSSSRFEPPSRSSTMESVESSSTVTLVPAAKGHQEEQHGTSSTATTARVDRSGRLYLRERIIQLEQDGETNETQQHQHIQHVEQADQRRCRDSIGISQTVERPTARASAGRRSSEFVAPQRSHAKPRAARPSPVPVVTDISMDMGPRGSHRVQRDESEVLQRLSCLEERVLQLSVQNENLTRINDELSGLLVEMTNKFRSDINSLRAQLAEVSLETTHRPDPCNLRVAREMSDGCYEIIWDMPLVQCYKVLTNGVESGIVRAPNNAARISDVEPGTELRVQVQAIHFDGRLGEPSNSLVIRRSER